MRLFILVLFLFVAGCAIQPKSTCAVKVKGECRNMSASEQGGAGTRGHAEEPKEP